MSETGRRRCQSEDASHVRLVHIEPLRPGLDEDGLFGDNGRSLDKLHELFRLPACLLTRGNLNRATAETQFEYRRNRMRIALFGCVPVRVEPRSHIRIRLDASDDEETAPQAFLRISSQWRQAR
jgi:hypothetical protein